MLKPNKHLNIEYSILNISAILLDIMKESKIIKYDDLLKRLVTIKGEKAKVLYLKSLYYLYLIKKIRYYKNKDIIEFIL